MAGLQWLRMAPAKRRAFRALVDEKWGFHCVSASERESTQLEKLRSLLIHAGENVPFYRELFAQVGFRPARIARLSDLRALPVLTKEIIQDREADLQAVDAQARKASVNFTGGSTGYPLSFRQCHNYRMNNYAATLAGNALAGCFPGARTASLWGSPRDIGASRSLYEAIRNLLANRRYYNSFEMSLSSMRRYLRAMRRFRPKTLIGYAESLDIFARFLDENCLKPNFLLDSIISSAGTLLPPMRSRIERAFGAPVFDRYGCRELGLIACECDRRHGLHINGADQIVELIGDDPHHQPSEIIVTNLNNYAMPFVRYRVGDLAVLSSELCTCGRSSPMLKRIVGRTTDTITTGKGELIYGAHFRHVFFGLKGIRKFQFVQETVDWFRLDIVATKDLKPETIEEVRRRILHTVGGDSRLDIEFVDDIPPSASGKFLFVISKVPVVLGQSMQSSRLS